MSPQPRRASPPALDPKVVEDKIIACRRTQRRGQDWITVELWVPARTASLVLRRHQMPYLA